jgi:cell division protein FtsB
MANSFNERERSGAGDWVPPHREIAALRAERDRLLKANEMMEAVLADLHGKHDGVTCGRVQCRNALRVVVAERDETQLAYETALSTIDQQKSQSDEWRADAVEAVSRMYIAIEDRDELRAELDELHVIHKAMQDERDDLEATLDHVGVTLRDQVRDLSDQNDALEAEVERMRPVVDDYLRQAKNRERHREAGGILNMAEQTIVDKARAYRQATEQEAHDA